MGLLNHQWETVLLLWAQDVTDKNLINRLNHLENVLLPNMLEYLEDAGKILILPNYKVGDTVWVKRRFINSDNHNLFYDQVVSGMVKKISMDSKWKLRITINCKGADGTWKRGLNGAECVCYSVANVYTDEESARKALETV